MASNAPKKCCTEGFKHEYVPAFIALDSLTIDSGQPSGKTITIDGSIEAYVAEASGPCHHGDAALLYLPDVIGIWQNSQLMADQFAANGYTTVVLDTFNKDPVKLNRPEGFQLSDWIANGTGGGPHTQEYIDPIVEKAIKYIKDRGFKKIGAVGYCFVSTNRNYFCGG
jgi:dienelactone hydrolase